MESKFSYFRAPITNLQPYRAVSLVNIYQVIAGSWFKEKTIALRNQSGDAARQFKSFNFDYCTFSGTFHSRKASELIQHSNLICLDFDHIGPDIPSLRLVIQQDPEIRCSLVFVSPSGDGLKAVIEIDISLGSHKDWFESLRNYFSVRYCIEPDKSGSDVSRACFLPYDPECFINQKYLQNGPSIY